MSNVFFSAATELCRAWGAFLDRNTDARSHQVNTGAGFDLAVLDEYIDDRRTNNHQIIGFATCNLLLDFGRARPVIATLWPDAFWNVGKSSVTISFTAPDAKTVPSALCATPFSISSPHIVVAIVRIVMTTPSILK